MRLLNGNSWTISSHAERLIWFISDNYERLVLRCGALTPLALSVLAAYVYVTFIRRT